MFLFGCFGGEGRRERLSVNHGASQRGVAGSVNSAHGVVTLERKASVPAAFRAGRCEGGTGSCPPSCHGGSQCACARTVSAPSCGSTWACGKYDSADSRTIGTAPSSFTLSTIFEDDDDTDCDCQQHHHHHHHHLHHQWHSSGSVSSTTTTSSASLNSPSGTLAPALEPFHADRVATQPGDGFAASSHPYGAIAAMVGIQSVGFYPHQARCLNPSAGFNHLAAAPAGIHCHNSGVQCSAAGALHVGAGGLGGSAAAGGRIWTGGDVPSSCFNQGDPGGVVYGTAAPSEGRLFSILSTSHLSTVFEEGDGKREGEEHGTEFDEEDEGDEAEERLLLCNGAASACRSAGEGWYVATGGSCDSRLSTGELGVGAGLLRGLSAPEPEAGNNSSSSSKSVRNESCRAELAGLDGAVYGVRQQAPASQQVWAGGSLAVSWYS